MDPPPNRACSATALRAPLACLACRAAKMRCTGLIPPDVLLLPCNKSVRRGQPAVPAENPCPRCAQHNIPCLWKPCSRTGRPRKRPRSPSPASVKSAETAGPVGKRAYPSPPASREDRTSAPPPASPPVDSPHTSLSAPSPSALRSNTAWPETEWELNALTSLLPDVAAAAQPSSSAAPSNWMNNTGQVDLLQSLFWPTPDTFSAFGMPAASPTLGATATPNSLVTHPVPHVEQERASTSPHPSPSTGRTSVSSTIPLSTTSESGTNSGVNLAPNVTAAPTAAADSPLTQLQPPTPLTTPSEAGELDPCCSLPILTNPLRALHERIQAVNATSVHQVPAVLPGFQDEIRTGYVPLPRTATWLH